MADSNLSLNGAALIVGSLLWQPDLEEGDGQRKQWRDSSLEFSQKIFVRAPIRYGRLSGKSDPKVYTMTFSNSVKRKMGSAFVVPFIKKELSLDEIVEEARQMSNAEGMKRRFIPITKWAVMGILFNPKFNKILEEKKVIERWRAEQETEFDFKKFKIGKEKSSIDDCGRLNIPWPVCIDGKNSKALDEIDFIIASATEPTDYPSDDELRQNVRNDKKRYYFLNNLQHGITTFQDSKVLNKL